MILKLIQGDFDSKDSIEIINQLVQVKIKYHEGKIKADSNEEDIKYREEKIKTLQKEFFELRNNLQMHKGNVGIVAEIKLIINEHESN